MNPEWRMNFHQPKFHQVLGILQPFLTNTISIFQNRGHQSWRHHAVLWEWGLRDSKNLLGNGWDFGARSFSHRIPVANSIMTLMWSWGPSATSWILEITRNDNHFNSLYSNCWSFRNPCTTPEIYCVKLSYQTMKKHEKTGMKSHSVKSKAMSRAVSRKLKAYRLRQDGWSSWGKKIRVKNLNLEPQVEICKYIEQYIMLHDQQYSIILHLDNYYIVSLYSFYIILFHIKTILH